MARTQETQYTTRMPLPDMIERGSVNTLRCPVYDDGALVAPASGTVSIHRGSQVIVDAASVSVVGDVAEYSYDAPDSLTLSDGYRVEWTLVFSGIPATTHAIRNEAMVVRRRLYCPISDTDLFRRASSLDPSGPDPISRKTDYEDYIHEAWVWVQGRLLESGRRPYLVISPYSLREVAIEKSLQYIFQDFAHRLNDAYAEMAEAHRLQAEKAWDRVSLTYDQDDDGTADEVRRRARPNYVFLSRGE